MVNFYLFSEFLKVICWGDVAKKHFFINRFVADGRRRGLVDSVLAY